MEKDLGRKPSKRILTTINLILLLLFFWLEGYYETYYVNYDQYICNFLGEKYQMFGRKICFSLQVMDLHLNIGFQMDFFRGHI